jgi:hypothetical protein
MPMLVLTALFTSALTQTARSEYKAKLGEPYLVGVVGRVSGDKKSMELGESRLVTLHSVRTAIRFDTMRESILAPKGKKLVIFEATIKNPEKRTITVSDSSCFGLRVYDTKFKASDITYRGSCAKDRSLPNRKLASGESFEVFSVYEFPAETPHLRIGIYYHTYLPKSTPRFDLTKFIEDPSSVFAKSNMVYTDSCTTSLGKSFDLDALNFKVLSAAPTTEGGYAVRMEITNPMLLPGAWGWQFAQASVKDAQERETAYYPAFFVDPADSSWKNEIAPGKAIVGEYRFYPSADSKPSSLTLKMNATERTVIVRL